MTALAAPVAGIPAEQALLRRLTTLPAAVGFCVPGDAEEAWERACEEANRSARAIARLGLYLIWLHTELDDAAFAAGLLAHDIDREQAAHAMRIARLVLELETSPGRGARILDLNAAQAQALSRIDPDELSEAVDQGELDLDDVAAMSPRMLREEVRRLRARREDLAGRLDEERDARARLEREQGGRSPVAGMPASIVRLREETGGFAEAALADLSALSRQVELLLDAPDLGPDRAVRERFLQEGARTMMLHAGAVLAEAHGTYRRLAKRLEPWLGDDWMATAEGQPPPLAAEEAGAIRRWRDAHMGRLGSRADEREAGRVARGDVRRGRGRPRKSAAGGR